MRGRRGRREKGGGRRGKGLFDGWIAGMYRVGSRKL